MSRSKKISITPHVQSLIDISIRLFDVHWERAYPQAGKFNWGSSNHSTIRNFILSHKEITSLGESYLQMYINYQFRSLLRLNRVRMILPTWVFGDKALKRWERRGKNFHWEFDSNLIGISQIDIQPKRKPGDTIDTNKLMLVEELERKRYLNIKKFVGLLWCLSETSLYHPKSEYCPTCIYREKCMEIFRMNYPHIYRERIETWQTTTS